MSSVVGRGQRKLRASIMAPPPFAPQLPKKEANVTVASPPCQSIKRLPGPGFSIPVSSGGHGRAVALGFATRWVTGGAASA
jgi:hypothetical protein